MNDGDGLKIKREVDETHLQPFLSCSKRRRSGLWAGCAAAEGWTSEKAVESRIYRARQILEEKLTLLVSAW